jgi:peroxiredoxin
MPKKIMRGLFFLFLVSFLGCGPGGMGAGYDAPAFKLKDLERNTVSLEEHRGRIVVVDFWATWCSACLMSIPELVEVQEKYRDEGVTVLGISVDLPEEISEADLLGFKNKLKMNYSILRADRQVMADYFAGGESQVAIPTLFVVDRQGRIRDKLVGFRPGKLEETLQKLLS